MFEGFRSYLHRQAGLSDTLFDELAGYLTEKPIAKGQLVLQAGEICQHAFFVENGLLKLFSLDETGGEHIIQFAVENGLVGDRSSMFFSQPSEFYIEAIENTTVVLFDQAFIGRAAEVSTSFRVFNERLLQNHIRQLQNRVSLLLGASAEKRYLAFIRLYPDLMLRVPQWMIASYLGITPESLSRVRKELARKNFRPNV